MRTFCFASALVLLIGVAWATPNLRREGVVEPSPEEENINGARRELQDADAPIWPIAVETMGHSDPLLAGLSIPNDASIEGVWGALEQWPAIPIHVAVLPNGKVITYGARPGVARYDGRTYTFWDPKLGIGDNSRSIIQIAERVQSFCSSGVLLHDGTFVVAGGKGQDLNTRSVETSLMDYETETGRRTGNLHKPHWYGSMTKLADGRTVMTGGGTAFSVGRFQPNTVRLHISPTPEIYTIGEGWKQLHGARSLEAFGADNNGFWYPRQFITNTGTMFGITSEKMWEMSFEGEGSVTVLGTFKTAPDLNSALRPNTGPTGSAVMYDVGKIIQMGGNGYANGYKSFSSKEASLFDINDIANGNVNVTETSPMEFPRQWLDAAVLPDGKVLVTGGSTYHNTNGPGNEVKAAELWDPKTGNWTTGSSASVYRGYHASQALLPNGAVFTGGGGIPGPVVNFNAEIYFPPYFFEKVDGVDVLATKPRIVSISTNVLNHQDVMHVQVETGTVIDEVSLSCLPVTTHSFDTAQRRMTLDYTQFGTDLMITMPLNANLAPPGHYYLSVINPNGIPSESVIIAVGAKSPPVPGEAFPGPIEPVTGPFELEANVRFDNIINRRWQRVIDFSNGPGADDIIFGQFRNTDRLLFTIYREAFAMHLVTPAASLVLDEMAHWKAGVNSTGWMFIEKNGVRVAERQGHVPRNVYRTFQYVARSVNPSDPPLEGLVDGVKITNLKGYNDGGALNKPEQITGAFSIKASAVFNNLAGRSWQRVFDFANGRALDMVVLTQVGSSTSIAMEIWLDNRNTRLTAVNAIVEGEMATWRCGVESTGLMFIEKNGVRLADKAGITPRNVFRRNLYVGRSNWPGNSPLAGAVLGLEVTNEIEMGVPEQITGAFTMEASARFDDLGGTVAWQRIFDFGNGPRADNIVLAQFSNTKSINFEVYIGTAGTRLVVPDVLVEGELANWMCGVDVDGTMWVAKNGVRVGQRAGNVPRDVFRANMLFGESNWPNDAEQLGVVLGHDVTNEGETKDDGLLNLPGHINGTFSVEATARFDDLSRSWQRIFDFGNGEGLASIAFGQEASTATIRLEIRVGTTLHTVTSAGAIIVGEMAMWKAGVDATGLMFIFKNGNRLTEGPGGVPLDEVRNNMLVGYSNTAAHDDLDGVVLGLRVNGGDAFAATI